MLLYPPLDLQEQVLPCYLQDQVYVRESTGDTGMEDPQCVEARILHSGTYPSSVLSSKMALSSYEGSKYEGKHCSFITLSAAMGFQGFCSGCLGYQ
jgi:hypothetical protein